MALFIVRPSRGAWAFFGLIALAAIAARGYDHHEHAIARRDGPVASVALDFARCVFGPDTPWILDDTGPDRQAIWSRRFADWFRNAATSPQAPDWPASCSPLAEFLASRLEVTPAAPERASALARSVASDLQAVTGDPMAFLNAADGETLTDRMATLLAMVRGMSSGATGRWDHDEPQRSTRHATAQMVRLPRLLQLAPATKRPILLSDSALMYCSTVDGILHVLEFTATDRREALLDPSIPMRERTSSGLRQVESDDGPSIVRLSPTPRLVRFPSEFVFHPGGTDTWEAVEGATHLGLLTVQDGSVTFRATPRDGPTAWSPWLSVGPGESALAAVLTAGDSDLAPGGFRVTFLRPAVDTAVVEQYTLALQDNVSFAVTDSPVPLTTGVRALGARVLCCTSGSVRYLLVASDTLLSVVRVEGAIARVAGSSVVLSGSAPPAVVCDSRRMMVETEPGTAHGGWHSFDFPPLGAPSASPVDPPLPSPEGRVEAMALSQGLTVALVSDRAALRTFVQTPGNSAWRSAGLVALLSPASGPLRTLSRLTAVAGPQQLAILLEGTTSPRPPPAPPRDETLSLPSYPVSTDEAAPVRPPPSTPFVTLLVSTDNGRSFTTP